MVDTEYRLVMFNQPFMEMYGLTSDIMRIGMPMREVIWPHRRAWLLPEHSSRTWCGSAL